MNDRNELMSLMVESDPFFRDFGSLDDLAFADGAISRKHKELCMVAISVVQKCGECAEYHIETSIGLGATRDELIEALKMGMMAGGSTTYPYVRRAFRTLKEKRIV